MKSSLRPLKIRTQLERDPAHPNIKVSPTEVRVPEVILVRQLHSGLKNCPTCVEHLKNGRIFINYWFKAFVQRLPNHTSNKTKKSFQPYSLQKQHQSFSSSETNSVTSCTFYALQQEQTRLRQASSCTTPLRALHTFPFFALASMAVSTVFLVKVDGHAFTWEDALSLRGAPG